MASLATMLQGYFGKSADIFTVIGAVTTAFFAFKATSSVLNGLFSYVLSGALGLSLNLENAGSWAVVTGCTDGIGKAYAEQLAKRGLNIVLISRTRSKLDELARDIESRFKVKTKVIAADFTRSDIYDMIPQELDGLDIGTLVNNVGMGYDHPEFFDQLENRDQVIMNIINCNSTSVAMMTSLVLPGMVSKKRGVIINIASAAGNRPTPLLTLYSATKSFVDFFSRALQHEYGPKGITVQVVLPYFVATKMSKIRKGGVFAPYPNDFVRSALHTVGLQSRTFGCWSHALQDKVAALLPTSVTMQMMEKARAKSLKKKANKSE
uniref:17-beta-hydroxysteroid dehydrogenase type 12 n=1 Tax=Nucella lapillus TaxID=51631 RepID=K7S9E9_NUCLP|nr:17-beta-hydroxysteroid dehydrogenase type 12 [Nucella lapillus]